MRFFLKPRTLLIALLLFLALTPIRTFHNGNRVIDDDEVDLGFSSLDKDDVSGKTSKTAR